MRIELPKSWSDVSIGQFIELTKAKENCEDEIDMTVELLSIMSGVGRNEIAKISLTDITKLSNALQFLHTPLPDKIEQRVKVNGVDYYADLRIDKMVADQYMVLKEYQKGGNSIEELHKILSVFYIPVTKKFGEVDINAIADDFYKGFPVAIAYPAAVFFLKVYKSWMSYIADCLEKHLHQLLMTTSLK